MHYLLIVTFFRFTEVPIEDPQEKEFHRVNDDKEVGLLPNRDTSDWKVRLRGWAEETRQCANARTRHVAAATADVRAAIICTERPYYKQRKLIDIIFYKTNEIVPMFGPCNLTPNTEQTQVMKVIGTFDSFELYK